MARRADSSLEWVRRPQQARSQQTLERLLDAAEALIVEQGVEATGVSQVARRARSSVGAFYSRFADKDALVRSVFERFTRQAEATMDSALDPVRWQGTPTPEVARTVIRFLLRVVRERRLLIASLVTYAQQDVMVTQWLDSLVLHLGSRLAHLLRMRGELPRRADPEQAVLVACGVLLSTAQARVMRPPESPTFIDDGAFAQELSHMALAYLGLADAALAQSRRGPLPQTAVLE